MTASLLLLIALGQTGTATVGQPQPGSGLDGEGLLAMYGLVQPQAAPKPTAAIQKLLDEAGKLQGEEKLKKLQEAVTAAERAKDKVGEARAWTAIGDATSGQASIAAYEKGLVKAKESGDLASEARCFYGSAFERNALGFPQKALELYNQALPLYRRIGDQNGEAEILLNIAELQFGLGKSTEALDSLAQARILYRRLEDERGEADCLANAGMIWLELREAGKVVEMYMQALPILQRLRDEMGEAVALLHLGMAHSDLKDDAKAVEFYDRAFVIFEKLKDDGGLARCLLNSGISLEKLRDYAKALERFSLARPIYLRLGDELRATQCLVQAGIAHSALGDPVKALESFIQAIPVFKRLKDDTGEATCLTNVGTIYYELGDTAQALEHFSQALAIFERTGNESGQAYTLVNSGNAQYELGNKTKARALYSRALPISRRIGDLEQEANCLANDAVVSQDLEEHAEALKLLSQALAIFRQIRSLKGEATCLANSGLVHDKLGDNAMALECYSKSVSILHQIEDRESEKVLSLNLATLAEALGQTEAAIVWAKRSVNLAQAARRQVRSLDQSLQDSLFAQEKSRYQLLADLLIKQGRIAEAEQVMGLLKDDELYVYLRSRSEDAKRLDGQVDLTKAEQEWAKELEAKMDASAAIGRRMADLVALKTRTPEQEKELTDLRAKYEAAVQAFTSFMRQTQTDFFDPAKAAASAKEITDDRGLTKLLAEAGRKSGRKAVLVSTVAADKALSLIVTTPDSRSAVRQEVSLQQVSKLVAEFRAALLDPSLDPRPAGKALYDLLVKPIEKTLKDAGAETLMFRLDGPLRYVPMAALWDGKQYLIQRNDIALYTSAGRQDISADPNDAWSAAAFAASAGGSGFTALPGAKEELEAVVRLLGGDAYLDGQFTKDAFQAALQKQNRSILHIATHFSLKPGDNNKSVMLLGDGTTLPLSTITGFGDKVFAGVEVLVLSACDTGSVIRESAQVESFTALCQLLGAKSVISSLWPVDDGATKALMEEFYRRHKANPKLTKAQALREAQLALLNGEVKTASGSGRGTPVEPSGSSAPKFAKDPNRPLAHPAYWAAFVLSGNWR